MTLVDRCAAWVTGALWAIALAAYAVRVRRAPIRSGRVEQIGGSLLVGRGVMDATYWSLDPAIRRLAALGVTANALTWSALVLGMAAAIAVATGAFGLACLVATGSTLCDVLDGQVARMTGTGSARGELLDAAIDRYTELGFLGGLVLYVHESAWQTAVVLAAMLACFMVSYASAKAEALHVSAPRGLMRRHERAVYLLVGAGLVPLVGPAFEERATPILAAAAVVAVVGNVAAITRLVRISRALA